MSTTHEITPAGRTQSGAPPDPQPAAPVPARAEPGLPRASRPLLRRSVRRGLLVLLFLSVVQQACVTSYLVSGNSMLPSFHNGDRVVVARMPAMLGDPERGDTVIARVDGEIVIKRVMGLPGETVRVGDGRIYCGGEAVEDPVPSLFRGGQDMPAIRLGADEYFLMGDHRRVSIDSREFGPVRRSWILGRVILRVAAED